MRRRRRKQYARPRGHDAGQHDDLVQRFADAHADRDSVGEGERRCISGPERSAVERVEQYTVVDAQRRRLADTDADGDGDRNADADADRNGGGDADADAKCRAEYRDRRDVTKFRVRGCARARGAGRYDVPRRIARLWRRSRLRVQHREL
jgi:hypothetical protein